MSLEDFVRFDTKVSAYVWGSFFFCYGVYFILFWPKRLRKAIAEGKASPQHEKQLRWTTAAGVFLVILAVTWIALAFTGVIRK